jgi:hypothetical protein
MQRCVDGVQKGSAHFVHVRARKELLLISLFHEVDQVQLVWVNRIIWDITPVARLGLMPE